MKDIVSFAFKVLWIVNFIFYVIIFAFSRSISAFVTVVLSSLILLCILYSLLSLLKFALKGKINFGYFLIHNFAIAGLILFSGFIFKFYKREFLYLIYALISYPLFIVISFIIAYTYKTLSRK